MSDAIPPALAAKLRRFTVPGEAPGAGVETVVLADPQVPLEDALRIAGQLVREGARVRVIGAGATLQRSWPRALDRRSMALTEWGALHYASLGEMTIGVQREMRDWIRSVAGDLFGGLDADRILFAAACNRFFQRIVVRSPVAVAVTSAFPGAAIRLVGSDPWLQILLAGARQRSRPSRQREDRLLGALLWRARITALGGVALAASVARAAADRVSARRTFSAIDRLRRRDRPLPDTWVGVAPDWYRINQHLLRALALPETERGASIGVIFVSTLATGLRDEGDMRVHHPSAVLWPGLGELASRLDRCVVDQAVLPGPPLAFARELFRAVVRSAILLARLGSSSTLRLPFLVLPHSSWIRPLVTWATIDVVRASLAQAAAQDLVRRTAGSIGTFSVTGSGSANVAAADLVLQRAGVATFDHPHGAGGDNWTGEASSASSVRCVWTLPDAHAAGVTGQRTLVTGMPAPRNLAPRHQPARHILVMSNYVHRDTVTRGRYPLKVFQDELLSIVPLLRSRGHADKEFRWRPHPADNAALIAAEARKHDGLVVSRGGSPEEDAEWADVVISSISTSLIEILFAGVPVFVHTLPEYWGTDVTSFIDPSRLFFHAQDGADAVSEWLERHGSDPTTGLAEEERSRRALFGPSGEPSAMTDHVGRASQEMPSPPEAAR